MNKRIIIVDDYQYEFIKDLLENAGITNITAFACPFSVLKDVKDYPDNAPILVVSDFHMFGMNGVELLMEVKLLNSAIKGVIYTTANEYVESLESGFKVIEKMVGCYDNLIDTVSNELNLTIRNKIHER